MTTESLQSQWEAKQERIKFLIDFEIDNRTEEIEKLQSEIHELMKLDYEIN